MFSDLMGSSQAQICFRAAFMALINENRPVCHLSTLPHWRSKDKTISSAVTFFLNGYFYNFFTSVPGKNFLERKIQVIKEHKDIDQIIIPSVRKENYQLLSDLNFQSYNEDKEVGFHFNNCVDTTLRREIGSHKYREIKRFHRKSFSDFSFEWLKSSELSDEFFDAFDELDIAHVKRHKSIRRIYTRKVHTAFINSPIAENFRWFIRRDMDSGQIVQAGLVLLGFPGGTVYYLNQSINHNACNKNQNLYIAAFYEIYLFAQSHAYQSVHMGRGLEQVKINLGANKIIDQSSWILSL